MKMRFVGVILTTLFGLLVFRMKQIEWAVVSTKWLLRRVPVALSLLPYKYPKMSPMEL